MDKENLYAKLLGLSASWQVEDVTVSEALKTVTVYVGPAPGSLLRCPHCRQICPGWVFADLCGWDTTRHMVRNSHSRTVLILNVKQGGESPASPLRC